MAEDCVDLLEGQMEKPSRKMSCWPRRCIFGSPSLPSLTSTRLLIFIIFGLLLRMLWNDGYFEVLFYRRLIQKPFRVIERNESCLCNGENFCFKGLDENGTTVNGRRFDCSLYEGLKARGLLDTDAAETKGHYEHLDDSWNPVFVSSIASNHFSEGRKLVRSIAEHYPDSKIIIFDIGMTSTEVAELKTWCNVEYKLFNFDQYPDYVRALKTYAFKLVIVETLQEHGTFFYFDTSVRVTGKNLLDFLHGVQNKNLLPFSTHTFASHSVYSTTHQEMNAYLPLPIVITQMSEIQSTFQFISDAPYTRYVLKWWFLCATTRECIAPKGAVVSCKLGNFFDHKRTYMNCHRFDQAFWNIAALAYLFGEKRGALELGYTDEDWTRLTDNLVAQVENARNSAMGRFFKLVNIRREDRMKERLELKCKGSR